MASINKLLMAIKMTNRDIFNRGVHGHLQFTSLLSLPMSIIVYLCLGLMDLSSVFKRFEALSELSASLQGRKARRQSQPLRQCERHLERHFERVRLERLEPSTFRAPDAQPRSSCFPVYREHPGSPGSFGGRYDIRAKSPVLSDVGTERMPHFRNSNASSQRYDIQFTIHTVPINPLRISPRFRCPYKIEGCLQVCFPFRMSSSTCLAGRKQGIIHRLLQGGCLGI